MKRHPSSKRIAALGFSALTVALAPAAQACTVCMGDPTSSTAEAMNAAIFLMLGCIGGVLALLSAFGIYLYRRAQNPAPPHSEFTDNFQPQNGLS
jgi:hypothetical protein